MEALLVLLVFALAALFFAGEVLVGLPSMRFSSRQQATTNVNRAALRGDSAEVKKEMERVQKEAHAAFDAGYGGSQRSLAVKSISALGEVAIGSTAKAGSLTTFRKGP